MWWLECTKALFDQRVLPIESWRGRAFSHMYFISRSYALNGAFRRAGQKELVSKLSLTNNFSVAPPRVRVVNT